MQSALLANGKIITAKAYDESLHGVRIYCMDSSCGVPVFHVSGTKDVASHFKTSGRGTSIHKEGCGFAKKLSFQQTVEKVGEYQAIMSQQDVRELLVRLNMNGIDPDIEKRTIERTPKEEDSEPKEISKDILRDEQPAPQSISSLRSIKKLFTTVEPDVLASIIVAVKGKKIPISELISCYKEAHIALWEGETLNVPYFIHGTVDKVIRRDKVWYINFSPTVEGFFSLVIFDKHFKYFTLKDDDLLNKDILAFGYLKKNTFQKDTRKATEMVIKSNKYIEFL